MTRTTNPGDRGSAAISAASVLRRRCICEEDPANGRCACAVPVTRAQVGWLRAYIAQHPERVIILAEAEGAWMSALAAFLPPGADDAARVLAWMSAPYDLPPAAGLMWSADLGELLHMLGAPPPAAMS